MGGWLLVLASIASAVPLVLCRDLAIGGEGARQACFGLTLLPWMVVAGAPRVTEGDFWNSIARLLSVSLPVLVLAALVDAGDDTTVAGAWQAWVVAGVCLVLLQLCSVRASRHSRWHGFAWLFLILVLPTLGGLFELFASTDPSATLAPQEFLTSWSPLSFCLRLATGDSAALGSTALACTAASLAILFGAAEIDRRRATAHEVEGDPS